MQDRPSESRIESVINSIGKWVSLLIILIMAITTWEVASRYLFNRPTTWAWLVNRQLFGVFILMAGAYTLVQRSHIRIEILYDRFSKRSKRVIQYLSFAALVCFAGALAWQGALMGMDSYSVREHAAGMFRLPLYPLKLLIPVFGILYILAGIPVFLKKSKR
jgi:TRAP-type mannitol/chloroaromatic compound transport system permease small subunit